MTKKLTKTIVSRISEDITKAVKRVAEAHDVVIRSAGGSYGPQNATIKLEIAVLSEDGAAMTEERKAYLECCEAYGLPREYLDKEFTHNGSRMKVVGLKLRSPKFPVLLEDCDSGKRFKFNVRGLKRSMGDGAL